MKSYLSAWECGEHIGNSIVEMLNLVYQNGAALELLKGALHVLKPEHDKRVSDLRRIRMRRSKKTNNIQPTYRILGNEEIMRRGDEFIYHGSSWEPVVGIAGKPVSYWSGMVGGFQCRRHIKKTGREKNKSVRKSQKRDNRLLVIEP